MNPSFLTNHVKKYILLFIFGILDKWTQYGLFLWILVGVMRPINFSNNKTFSLIFTDYKIMSINFFSIIFTNKKSRILKKNSLIFIKYIWVWIESIKSSFNKY